jgi:hypothetical protein
MADMKTRLQSIFSISWPMALLFLATAGEVYLFVFERKAFGIYTTPIVFTALAAIIGLVPMLGLGRKQIQKNQPSSPISPSLRKYILWAILGIGTIISTYYLLRIWAEFPVGLEATGDVIPSVELFAQRLLGRADGLPVYAEYHGFGYKLNPTYMPFQWLPFTISELGGFDSRWIAWGIFLIGMGLYYRILIKQPISLFWLILLAIGPFVVILEGLRHHEHFFSRVMFSHTIELMDVGYYFILAYSLVVGGLWLRSTGFILTILSRFSILFWVPFFFLADFFKENKKQAFLTGVIIFAGIILIYILPFLSQDWSTFSKGQGHYDRAAMGAWTSNDSDGFPYALKHGFGLAVHFFDAEGDSLEQIKTIQRTHLIGSILAAAFVGLIFLFRHKQVETKYFFLWGLKFYFAVFYALIQVPYPYLYLVPVMFSFWVLATMKE